MPPDPARRCALGRAGVGLGEKTFGSSNVSDGLERMAAGTRGPSAPRGVTASAGSWPGQSARGEMALSPPGVPLAEGHLADADATRTMNTAATGTGIVDLEQSAA